ncbi:MAG TPA: crossover junction endodeoxyribonuclease RuvC [Dehalococcoidia bacterium]|nr:crossover junction endodeoxyribonuclease RuvC [Dehalococcoidia bacterium]
MAPEGQPLRVLGIDPGSLVTGYGLVIASEDGLHAGPYGTWRLPGRLPLPLRLRQLYEAIVGAIDELQPHEVAVEDFYVGQVRAAVTIGQVRAMALLAAAQADLPVALYRPLEVKRAVAAYGLGEKAQVAAMVRALLDLPQLPQPDDAADALAVAICHCLRRSAQVALGLATEGRP